MKSAIFTICSCNYFHHAVTLMESLIATGSNERRFVVLVDEHYDPSEFIHSAFETVPVQALGISESRRLFFKYNVLELNTAVKPFVCQYFLDSGFETIVYLDPDIFVYHPLTRIWDHLRDNDVVVTPHITHPLCDGYMPDDLAIATSGIFNLGFLGLRKSPDVCAFVEWWRDKLQADCVVAPERGIFLDQGWCDFVPAFVDRTVIDRGHDLNVAYWNLAHREISLRNGVPHVGDEPLIFFHFSGLVVEPQQVFSKHENRFEVLGLPFAVSELIAAYLSHLRANGLDRFVSHPYGFGCFSDKRTKVPDILREIYRSEFSVRKVLGDDPFDVSGDPHFSKSLNEFVMGKGNPVSLFCREVALIRPDLSPPVTDPRADGGRGLASWFVRASMAMDIDDKFVAPVRNSLAKLQQGTLPWYRFRFLQWAEKIVRIARAKAHGNEHKRQPFLDHLVAMFIAGAWRFLERQTPDGLRLKVKLKMKDWLFGCRGAKPLCPPGRRSRPQAQIQDQSGLNIVGYVTAESGVGEAARCSARIARHLGIETAVIDFREGCSSRMAEDLPLATCDAPRHQVTLLHINADQMLDQALLLTSGPLSYGYNIGFWFWETSEFPDLWTQAFDCLDELWAASSFCVDVFSRKSPVPVIRMPLCVEPLPPAPLSRQDLGLPEDGFLFLAMADFLSTPERKNPLGALEAFHRAFGSTSEEAHLVLKLSNSTQRPEIREVLERWVNADSRIILIDGYMDRPKLNALINQCDCLVSLHRAEGFGLPIAEAMYMGKPAIATGWSANMDFMNTDNSLPVRYQLIPVNQESGPYACSNGVWAEPDLDHAASQMRRVAADTSLATSLGEAAQKTIREQYSATAIGQLMGQRLQFIRHHVWRRGSGRD